MENDPLARFRGTRRGPPLYFSEPSDSVEPVEEIPEDPEEAARMFGLALKPVLAHQFGLDMQEFAGTKVGAYLIGKCQQVFQRSMETMLSEAASDSPDLEAARRDGRAAGMVLAWIEEAITAGKNAEQQILETNRDEEQGNA